MVERYEQCVRGRPASWETHRAESLKLFIRDKTSIQTKEEDGGVGQHAPQDDQVVHVWTGHLD